MDELRFDDEVAVVTGAGGATAGVSDHGLDVGGTQRLQRADVVRSDPERGDADPEVVLEGADGDARRGGSRYWQCAGCALPSESMRKARQSSPERTDAQN